jgi:Domain of unknown function (DUF5625)
MKILKVLIAAFLIIFICMTVCEAFSWFSSTSPSTTLPTPVVKWPLDVSKRDSKINQEFRIDEYRSYYFALRFDSITKGSQDRIAADADRVLALVGEGPQEDQGIKISIHLKIIKPDTGSLPPKLIYEHTILTHGIYAMAFGYHLREIIAIDLKPGIYRVEANAIEDRPEFSGTPIYLQIEPHSQIKFLPGSIK